MFDNIFGGKKQGHADGKPQASPQAPIQPQARQPQHAQAKPQQPQSATHAPQVSGPLDSAKGGAKAADFQNVVDEASIIFASGEERTAAEMILRYLNETKGNVDKRVWYILLDIYHALGNRDNFEQLSIHFAKRFGTSPPSWQTGDGSSEAQPAKSAVAAGRNVLIIEGGIGGGIIAKTKEFVAAAKEMKTCKIDVSRMKPDQCDAEGLGSMQAVMGQLRKHKVAATLMGENHLATWLKKKVDSSKERQDPSDSPYWLLLLEILQWRGQMDEFEELSLEYTITYEISGPGWEPSGVMTIEAAAEVHDEGRESDCDVVPEPLVTDVSVQRIQDQIGKMIKEKSSIRLDFRSVKRMDFSSAGAFLGFVSSLGDDSKKLTIVGPSELIVALFDVVGLSPLIGFEPRKR